MNQKLGKCYNIMLFAGYGSGESMTQPPGYMASDYQPPSYQDATLEAPQIPQKTDLS